MLENTHNEDDFIKNTLVSISPEYEKLDYNKAPKKKSKKKVLETDGLSLLEKEDPGYISYGQIKKGRTFKVKENIEDWTSRDFVFFMRELYNEMFEDNWEFNFGGICLEINRIHDDVSLQNGFCNNIVLRDYINYYFKYYAKRLIGSNKKFYPSQLRSEKPIKYFLSNYNFKSSFDKEINNREKYKKVESIKKHSIEESVLVGEDNFMSEYGLVLFVNWFILVKNEDKVNVIKKAINLCRKMYKHKQFDTVLEVTKLWSPYPDWFAFSNVSKFLKYIKIDLNLEVKFINDNETNKRYEIMKVKNG